MGLGDYTHTPPKSRVVPVEEAMSCNIVSHQGMEYLLTELLHTGGECISVTSGLTFGFKELLWLILFSCFFQCFPVVRCWRIELEREVEQYWQCSCPS